MSFRDRVKALFAVFLCALLLACTTNPYTGQPQISKTAAGAVLGAAGGAGVGALAGGAVGAYMDVQEARLRERLAGTGVGVQRIGNDIVLRMPGNVTFETDRSDIRPGFYDVLSSVGLVLQEYDKTIIEVMGHTDSTGDAGYNQQLSTRRANAVAAYIQSQGVMPARILTRGFGEQYPVADNATAAGRPANRRVELRLVPLTA